MRQSAGAYKIANQALPGDGESIQKKRSKHPHLPDRLMSRPGIGADAGGGPGGEDKKSCQQSGSHKQITADFKKL